MLLILVFSLLLTSAPASAVCPASASALRADVEAAIAAYSEWQWEEFALREAAARKELSCVQEIVSPAQASRVHLLTAVAAFRANNEPLMVAAFRGVLAHDPAREPGADFAAPGSSIREAFEQARASGPGLNTGIQREGSWYVDGRPAGGQLPTQRTALVQLAAEGAVRSWYLDGESLPLALRSSPIEHGLEIEPARPSPASRAPAEKGATLGRASWGLLAAMALALPGVLLLRSGGEEPGEPLQPDLPMAPETESSLAPASA